MYFKDLSQDVQEKMIIEVRDRDEGWARVLEKEYERQYKKLRKTNQMMNASRNQMSDIGVRIHNRRLELEKSVENIAGLTGISKAKIRKYENGVTSTITADELVLLAIALDTTPNMLTGWYDIDLPEDDE